MAFHSPAEAELLGHITDHISTETNRVLSICCIGSIASISNRWEGGIPFLDLNGFFNCFSAIFEFCIAAPIGGSDIAFLKKSADLYRLGLKAAAHFVKKADPSCIQFF
jgi:hypothetical protein